LKKGKGGVMYLTDGKRFKMMKKGKKGTAKKRLLKKFRK
jgi:hypothetical protein